MKAIDAVQMANNPNIDYFLKRINDYANSGNTEMSISSISENQIEKLKSLGYKFKIDKWSGELIMSWGNNFSFENKTILQRIGIAQ